MKWPLLIPALLLAGCVTTTQMESGNVIDPARVDEITPTTTTEADALFWFGKPDERITLGPGSEQWRWERRESRTRTYKLLFANPTRTTSAEHALEIWFDDGIVKRYRFSGTRLKR